MTVYKKFSFPIIFFFLFCFSSLSFPKEKLPIMNLSFYVLIFYFVLYEATWYFIYIGKWKSQKIMQLTVIIILRHCKQHLKILVDLFYKMVTSFMLLVIHCSYFMLSIYLQILTCLMLSWSMLWS